MPVNRPVVPVPAATVVLLRDRPEGGFELLLIKRHSASRFAAGDYVFPGGKVEPRDAPDEASAWCEGIGPDDAARALGLPPRLALAHWVGVIRETFEEVGVLLARDAAGRPAHLEPATIARERAACSANEGAFWDMLRRERLTLATDRLVYFAHWITPEESPLRFNTRFFAAEMPGGQQAIADGREIVDVKWLAPAEALAAAARGDISMRNPTARNVELFVGATSATAAVARVTRRTITTIRPRVVMENGARKVLMPGDAGYW